MLNFLLLFLPFWKNLSSECDRTQEVIKSLLLAWLVGISLIAHLVECGPPEWGGVGSSPLETWSFYIGAAERKILLGRHAEVSCWLYYPVWQVFTAQGLQSTTCTIGKYASMSTHGTHLYRLFKVRPFKRRYQKCACHHRSLHKVRTSLPHEKSNCMYYCKSIIQ